MNKSIQVFIMNVIFSFTSIGMMVGVANGQEQTYFGMSETQFKTCKNLGKQVIAAQRASPDSIEHKKAYKLWDVSCGTKVMLNLARKHKISHIPASPLEWAEMN